MPRPDPAPRTRLLPGIRGTRLYSVLRHLAADHADANVRDLAKGAMFKPAGLHALHDYLDENGHVEGERFNFRGAAEKIGRDEEVKRAMLDYFTAHAHDEYEDRDPANKHDQTWFLAASSDTPRMLRHLARELPHLTPEEINESQSRVGFNANDALYTARRPVSERRTIRKVDANSSFSDRSDPRWSSSRLWNSKVDYARSLGPRLCLARLNRLRRPLRYAARQSESLEPVGPKPPTFWDHPALGERARAEGKAAWAEMQKDPTKLDRYIWAALRPGEALTRGETQWANLHNPGTFAENIQDLDTTGLGKALDDEWRFHDSLSYAIRHHKYERNPDIEAFVRGIRSNPDDHSRRLVFADWLQDHDTDAHNKFADHVRADVQIARRRAAGQPVPQKLKEQWYLKPLFEEVQKLGASLYPSLATHLLTAPSKRRKAR